MKGLLAVSTSASMPYHHGDLRQALLAAARVVLRERGAEAVSLREVARAAGVSHNAPYRHFPSREALLAALAQSGFEDLHRRLEAVAPALPALGQVYLDFATTERASFLLMFGSVPQKSAFPDLAAAACATLTVLDEAVTARSGGNGPFSPSTLRAWALVHGLAHLVADGQLSLEAATAALEARPEDAPTPGSV